MRALVLGASGQMGRAVAQELAARGWQVTAATRGGRALPAGLEGRVTAVAQSGSDAALIAGLPPFDAVFAPYPMDGGDGAALAGQRGRFGRLCVVSTASLHCDAEGRSLDTSATRGFPAFDDPVTEDSPVLSPGSGYSAGKAAMEAAVAGPGVTILRPCALWGIGARHPREWWFVKRALDGRRKVPVKAAGQSVFHTTSAQALARMAVLAFETGADGAFLIADAKAPSVAQIAAVIGQVTGHDFALMPVADFPEDLAHVGHSPWSAPTPFRVSTARAQALGWRPDTYDAATLRPYIDWLQARAATWQQDFAAFEGYPHDPFDYAAEDRALALLQAARQGPIPDPC